MNTPHDTDGRFDERADAREWQAQERARIAARGGAHAADDAGDEATAYRRIAHALRTPPPDRLPSNFAFQVAQLAARLPPRAQPDLRLERWLVRALASAMALGALASALVFGTGVLRALDAGGAGTAGWVLLLAACVLPTVGGEAWRMLRGPAVRGTAR